MTTTREGEDVDKPFIEKDWIGRGRIYNTTKIPAFVILAWSKVAEKSNIAVQLFQYRGRAREFRLVTDTTLLFASSTQNFHPTRLYHTSR